MTLLDDVRYAGRALVRAPIFTLVVVLTLALGIGANAAVFTVVNSILIKGLPYAEPDRLVALRFLAPGAVRADATVPSPAFTAWAARSQPLESAAAFNAGEAVLSIGGGDPVKIPSASISPNLFDVLGHSAPQIGRAFTAADAEWGAPKVAIVSARLWREGLASATDLAGTRIQFNLNGSRFTVVGVTPETFQFPDVITPDVLVPMPELPEGVVASLHAIARLRPGTTPERASAALAEITRAAQAEFPAAMAPYLAGTTTPEALPLQSHLAGDVRPVLLIAFGVAAAVLLIACANVAGLLLARVTGRERELAIRVAIGGTPARLARLLFVESVMLALAGGAAATLAVQWSLAALRHALAGTAPHAEAIAIDARVATGIILATLATSALCAAIPIGRMFTRSRQWDMKLRPSTNTTARHFARRALVAGQVAGAVVLLIGALLLLTTLSRLTNANVGFDSRNLLTMRVPAYQSAWPQPYTAGLDDVLARINALPGVTSAAATSALPLDGHYVGFPISVEGQPVLSATESGVGVDLVSPGYFSTMGIRLSDGRGFTDADTSTAPRVAIVNQAFLRWKHLSGTDALTRRLGLSNDPIYATTTIVGIVDDVKDTNPGDDPRPIVYKPFTQAAPNIGFAGARFVVRTTTDPLDLSEPVRQSIRRVIPNASIFDVQPMERRIAKLVAPQRQRAVVFGLFGITAVLLAAVGLYGLLAYIVSQEMREFGIRLAIGASRAQLLTLVLRRGLVSASIGLAVGLAGARLLTGVLAGMLYGVTPADPATYAAAALIMLVVATIASYVPARRAMHADPLVALRAE